MCKSFQLQVCELASSCRAPSGCGGAMARCDYLCTKVLQLGDPIHGNHARPPCCVRLVLVDLTCGRSAASAPSTVFTLGLEVFTRTHLAGLPRARSVGVSAALGPYHLQSKSSNPSHLNSGHLKPLPSNSQSHVRPCHTYPLHPWNILPLSRSSPIGKCTPCSEDSAARPS